MRKLILFCTVLFFCVVSFSQGHLEDFNDGDLTGWGGQADYQLSNTNNELEIVARKTSRWNSWSYDFSPVDISANPFVSLKIKSNVDINIDFSIWDNLAGNNYSYSVNDEYQEIVGSDDYAVYTFDFRGITGVDLTKISRLNFVPNPVGSEGCKATITIDDIQIGDQALVMPRITKIQDYYHSINSPMVTIPFWGIKTRNSGVVSITATSSNPSLIPNPTVSYVNGNSQGTLTYTPVANQAGTAVITVTTSEVGSDDNVMTFTVNLESNQAPKINPVEDLNIIAGRVTPIVLSGLDDGDPNANQSISIKATSSNTSIMPNPTIDIVNDGFNANVNCSPITGQSGTVTVTVVVQDDGGTINGGIDTETMTFDVIVYEDVNYPPSMKEISDISILEGVTTQSINLKDIDDGDISVTQGISITATSSNPALIPDPNIIYSSGLTSGELRYTPVSGQTGSSTITVTLTDDGGAANNNGNETVEYTFEIRVRVRPILGWADDFEDGILGSQWPGIGGDDDWGTENAHHCVEKDGALIIEIDKTRTNNKWAGLWFSIPNELDLSDNPYISIRMKIDPSNIGTTDDMLIFLWDAYDHYNTGKTVRHTVTDTYVEYYFDYSDPSYQLQSDGTVVDISRIKALLFNFDPGGNTLLQGSFFFDDLRIGDQANRPAATPQVTMDTIPDFVLSMNAASQTINLSNLSDGLDNSNEVTITATSSNTALVPNPTTSVVSNQAATLSYSPVASQSGNTIITVVASAAGSLSNTQTFSIDVFDLTSASADDIVIDLTTEYQEIDGFGAYISGDAKDTVTALAKDLGMSLARIGLFDNFEPVNDNSDPYITDLDAFNVDRLPIEKMKQISPFVDKFILTFWSPAGWMKKNKWAGGVYTYATDNILEPRFYQEYAEEVVAACKIVKRETGKDIYAVGLQNEPQFNEPYSSCKINPNEYRDLIKVVGERLEYEGLDVKLYWAEALPPQGALDDYINAVKNDPIAEGYADIAALHNYDADGASVGSAGCDLWKDFYSWANTGGTGSQYKTWMTETSGHLDNWDGAMTLAGNIFNALECGNVSAWVFWSFTVSESASKYGLVVSNRPSSRFYVSKQYYKFIRPGAVRVDVASAGIPSIAFKNDADGTVSIILFNNTESATAVEISGAGLPDQWDSYTTSYQRNCEKGVVVGADGLIALPPASITTLIGYSNVPPGIDPIENITVPQDAAIQTVNLSGISDGEEGAQTLTIIATSDNPALIPNPTISYTNGNSTGTLSFTPISGVSGTATITVTLTDNGSPIASTTEQFTITVASYNNTPSIDAISDLTINEDAVEQTINLSAITDGDGETQDLQITLSGYDESLIGTPAINYTSGNSTGSITFTPQLNMNGSTTITVTLKDNGGSTNGSDTYVTDFDIVINEVNDEPLITTIANQNAAPSTLKTVNLMGISDGDPENQVISISASSSNTSIVPNPTVNYTSGDKTGTLTFTPAALGTATITVTVNDNGGTANGGDNSKSLTFDVIVTSTVNENPTIDAIADQDVNYGASEQTISLTGISDGDAALTQGISISAVSNNPLIVPNPTVVYTSDNATGSLKFTPIATASGNATITVTITDDGTPAASTIIQFDITVAGINSTPTLDGIATPPAINEDYSQTITITLTGITDGGDGDQDITVKASEVTPEGNILTNISISYTSPQNTATLSYDVQPELNGNAIVYVTVIDNGGKAGGATDSVRRQIIQTVNPVNDAPTCDAIDDVSFKPGIRLVPLSGISDGDIELTQTLNVRIESNNPTLFDSIVYDDLDKLLVVTIPNGISGTAEVTMTINDGGGTENGGVEEITRTFNITVLSTNISDNAHHVISVYPNPANDILNINMFENTFDKLVITDVVGKLISIEDMTGKQGLHQVNVSNLTSGMYILNLKNKEGKFSARFIIE